MCAVDLSRLYTFDVKYRKIHIQEINSGIIYRLFILTHISFMNCNIGYFSILKCLFNTGAFIGTEVNAFFYIPFKGKYKPVDYKV